MNIFDIGNTAEYCLKKIIIIYFAQDILHKPFIPKYVDGTKSHVKCIYYIYIPHHLRSTINKNSK